MTELGACNSVENVGDEHEKGTKESDDNRKRINGGKTIFRV